MSNHFKNISNIYKTYKSLVLTIIILIVILLPITLVINNIMDIASKMKIYSYIGADVAYKNTISVGGEGRVYTKPDVAILDMSVVTEGRNIKNVQDENSEKMNKVISFLKGFNVEEKDIKTKNYRLYPRYNYEDRRVPQIIGYEITQTLEVKVRDMEKIGEILEQSISAGVNQVGSLRFSIDKDEELREEAREMAIKEAKQKAKKLAADLGVKLLKISGFNEGTSFDYPVPMYKEVGMGGTGDALQIQVGENEIVVNVTLVYEIN